MALGIGKPLRTDPQHQPRQLVFCQQVVEALAWNLPHHELVLGQALAEQAGQIKVESFATRLIHHIGWFLLITEKKHRFTGPRTGTQQRQSHQQPRPQALHGCTARLSRNCCSRTASGCCASASTA